MKTGLNLTLPSVGGSLSGETYAWSKLRFRNGTNEMNVTDAGSAGWIFGSGSTANINYWSTTNNLFEIVCSSIAVCDATTLNSWQGYFIYSNKNNLTLIRQN